MRMHAVARGVEIVVGIALLPFVLAHLSREQYGLWAWLLTISSYLTLADIGLSQGNVRLLASAIERRDWRRVGEIVSFATALHAAISAAVVVVLLLLASFTGTIRGAGDHPEVQSVFWVLLAAQAVTLCGFPFGSLLSGLQRLDLVHAVRIAYVTLNAPLTVWLLARGGGLRGLAWR